jgi:hypothetical protein
MQHILQKKYKPIATVYPLSAFKKEVCKTCDGTKKIDAMDYVYANEPHQAPIGSQPCPDCCVKVEDDYEA